jgi:DHA3 family macrolide efflux protein-like MFS transporter
MLLLLLWDESRGLLEIWHIYLLLIIASLANALQWPAFTAATTLLVPKRQFGRASGLSQMGLAISQIASPFLGALMLQQVQIRGILLVDLATFAFAVASLWFVTIPAPERTPDPRASRSLWKESAVGWTYLRERPGLFALLILLAGTNFNGIFAGLLVQGLILILGGVRPSVALIGTAAFAFLFTVPIINGCSQAIWQVKVPPDLQGRVFAVRRMVAQSSMPVAYFLAGPLADRVFEPMLAPGGSLAGSVGSVLGVGEGRGIAFLFVLLGLLVLTGQAALFSYPRLRKVDEELPDSVPDRAPAGVPSAAAPAPPGRTFGSGGGFSGS